MPAFLLPLLLLSGGSSLLGKVLGAAGDKENADAQEKAARENERQAYIAAADAYAQGSRQASQARTQGTMANSTLKTTVAAGGLDPSVGTPADVAAYNRGASEVNANTARADAARAAWGFKKQGRQSGQQAKAIHRAGNAQLFGNILGAVGDAAGMAYGAGSKGMFG